MLPIPQSQTTHHCKPQLSRIAFLSLCFMTANILRRICKLTSSDFLICRRNGEQTKEFAIFNTFHLLFSKKVQINCLRSYFVSDTKHIPFGDMAIPRIHNLLVLLFCQQSIFWCYIIVEVPRCTTDLSRIYYNSPIRVSAPLIRLPFRIRKHQTILQPRNCSRLNKSLNIIVFGGRHTPTRKIIFY